MNWRVVVVGTVALLVATALPVSAVPTLGSINTTDTDFNNAQTLQNVTVEGSGTTANVTLTEIDPTVDSFEDGDIVEYSGDTGNFTTSSLGSAVDGSVYLRSTGGGPSTIASTPGDGLNRYYGTGDGNYTAYVQLPASTRVRIGTLAKNSTYFYGLKIEPDLIEIGPYAPNTVCNPDCTGDFANVNVPTGEYLEVNIDQRSDRVVVWVQDANGNLLAKLDETRSGDYDTFEGIVWGANDSDARFDHAHLSELANTKPDGTYVGQNHTVDNVVQGFTDLTLQNATATVKWQGSNGNSWNTLDTNTRGSSGNFSVALSGLYDDYRVNVTYQALSGETTAKLHDEGVLVEQPGTLTVYNESSPEDVINTQQVNVTFFGSDGYVDSKVTSSGSVDLDNLPTNQTYVARVTSDTYIARTRYIDDLTASYNVYLLPDNETTADIVFKLDDNTGRYPPSESTLTIQRSLNVSGNSRYRTITSDGFGASNELPVTLEQDVRYRLVVENNDGDTRVLGPYTVTGDDPDAVLPIGQVIARGDTEAGTSFDAALLEDPRRVVLRYEDQQNATDTLYLSVTNVDTGNVIRQNTSVTGPFGSYQETVFVPAGAPDNVTYRVNYTAKRSDAPNRNGTRLVGGLPQPIDRLNLGSNVLFLIGWGTVIGLTGLVALVSAPAAAIVAPGTATLLTWVGALSVPLPLLAVAGAVGVIAAAGGAYR